MYLLVELTHLPRVQHSQPTKHRISVLTYLSIHFGLLWATQGEPGCDLALLVLTCKFKVSDTLRIGLLRQIGQGGVLHGCHVFFRLLQRPGEKLSKFTLIILEAFGQ